MFSLYCHFSFHLPLIPLYMSHLSIVISHLFWQLAYRWMTTSKKSRKEIRLSIVYVVKMWWLKTFWVCEPNRKKRNKKENYWKSITGSHLNFPISVQFPAYYVICQIFGGKEKFNIEEVLSEETIFLAHRLCISFAANLSLLVAFPLA